MALGLSVRHETCLASNWLFYWLWALLSFPPEFPSVFRCNWQCPCTTTVNSSASEWYAGGAVKESMAAGCRPLSFPGRGGDWDGRVVRGAWNSKAPQQAGLADDPGLDPSAMLSQGARTQRSKACLDQWRPTENIILLNEVVLMVLFFSISQTKILISQTKILNEVVLIVLLFLSISQTKIIIYKSAIGMEQSYIFYIVNLNCWYYYQTQSLNVIQIKEMYCRTKVCNSQTERHSAVVIISWICL